MKKCRVFTKCLGWSEVMFIFDETTKFTEMQCNPQTQLLTKDDYIGTYEFDSYMDLNYYRLRNSRQTINFIYSNGKYYISNGIGYKIRSKIAPTYNGGTIPDKVKNDLDKYLKSFQ
jgi:hypothetical protein